MKILCIVSALLGLYYLICGIIAIAFANFTIGNIICIFLAIVFLSFGFFYNIIKKLCKTKLLKVFKTIILAGCICIVIFSFALEICGSFNNTKGNEDAVIILGAAVKGTKVSSVLKSRLDAAFEYLEKNQNAVVVVSGGKGFQEEITEAEAMEIYLVNKGIDKNRIIKEEKATSTFENFKFSKELLDNRFEKEYEVVAVTNNFHILRASLIAKNAGLSATHIGSDIAWYDIAPSAAREVLAIIKYLIL